MRLGDLSIETVQLRNVPWIVRYFTGLLMLQSICSASNDFSNDERSFPWGSKLVHLLLLQSSTKSPTSKDLVRSRQLW